MSVVTAYLQLGTSTECVCILPETGLVGAMLVGERIRKKIGEHLFRAYDEALNITVSLGVAVYTVSRSGIWKVEPGGAVTRVRDEHWWDGCGRGSACRESVPGPLALA